MCCFLPTSPVLVLCEGVMAPAVVLLAVQLTPSLNGSGLLMLLFVYLFNFMKNVFVFV